MRSTVLLVRKHGPSSTDPRQEVIDLVSGLSVPSVDLQKKAALVSKSM